jgi:hypothetical protein
MRARVLVAVVAALVLAGCAGARVEPPGGRGLVTAPAFAFETDTFAFPNDIRARDPDKPDLYANYCFVLARAVRQFHAGARFDPSAPRLAADGYVERVRAVAARPPWLDPLPPGERVVIPGYANLREFSRAEEHAVKAGLGGRFWTWVHWTNWRVTFPVTRSHQEGVAHRIVDELSAGRLVQLLVTNWPKPELNHTVVVYAARESAAGVELSVWDPNDPSAPGVMTFEREGSRFFATRLYDTEPGPIRAFRMYHSWLL